MVRKLFPVVVAFAVIGAALLIIVSAATNNTAIDSDVFDKSETIETKTDTTAFGGDYFEFAEGDIIDPPIGSVCDSSGGLSFQASQINFSQAHSFGLDSDFPSFNLAEGPIWDGEQFYLTRIAPGTNRARIYSYKPGQTPVAVTGMSAGVNGLAIDKAGTIFAARYANGSLATFNPADKTFTTVVDSYGNGAKFNGLNDVAVGSKGYYLTDQNWQNTNSSAPEQTYFIDLNGSVTVIPRGPNKPNGAVVSPDGKTLYVSGQDGVYKYAIGDNGMPSGPSKIFTAGSGADGMGVDCLGNLYIANFPQQIVVLSPSGARLAAITIPGAQLVTNVSFGGTDGKTLLITTAGSTEAKIFTSSVTVPGLPY